MKGALRGRLLSHVIPGNSANREQKFIVSIRYTTANAKAALRWSFGWQSSGWFGLVADTRYSCRHKLTLPCATGRVSDFAFSMATRMSALPNPAVLAVLAFLAVLAVLELLMALCTLCQ